MEYEIYEVDTKMVVAEADSWIVAKLIASALRQADRESDYKPRKKVSS